MIAPRPQPDYGDAAYWRGTIKMSLSKFFILAALCRAPLHGYGVVGAVARMSQGCCSPSQGSVYPALAEFERGGYVTARAAVVQGRARKVYALTPKGRAAFDTALAAWGEATAAVTACRAAAP